MIFPYCLLKCDTCIQDRKDRTLHTPQYLFPAPKHRKAKTQQARGEGNNLLQEEKFTFPEHSLTKSPS